MDFAKGSPSPLSARSAASQLHSNEISVGLIYALKNISKEICYRKSQVLSLLCELTFSQVRCKGFIAFAASWQLPQSKMLLANERAPRNNSQTKFDLFAFALTTPQFLSF